MKKIFLSALLITVPFMLFAQSPSIRHMFRSYDPGKEVRRIHIPSVLTTFASWFVDDDETRYLLKNIKSVYVLASEDSDFSKESGFPTEIATRLKELNFEEMMVVNSKGEKINILMRDKTRKKNEFVIAIDGDEDAVVYIRSKMELGDFLSNGDFSLEDLHLDEVANKI